MSIKFETVEDWNHYIENGKECPDVVRDTQGDLWLTFQNEDGDSLGVRPRAEDDGHGPDDDQFRPIGPVNVEAMNFPLTIATLGWENTDQEKSGGAETFVYRVITPEGDTRESAEGFTYMTDEGWLHPEPGDTVERAVLEWETDYVVPNEDAPEDDE